MATSSIDLSGVWRFELDPEDRGRDQGWHTRDLGGRLELPGSLQAQGFGHLVSIETDWTARWGGTSGQPFSLDWLAGKPLEPHVFDGDTFRMPFWLQPDRHYVGAAWYQRDIELPEQWRGKRIVLSLERVHWLSEVWIGDAYVGSCDSLSTPHRYELPQGIAPGRHRLTLRIDNGMIVDVGINAHSVTDHTQTNWNGAIGAITLEATDPVWIKDVQAYPDIAAKAFSLQVAIGNQTGQGRRGVLSVEARSLRSGDDARTVQRQEVAIGAGGTELTLFCPLGDDAALWDEFNPALYELLVRIETTGEGPAFSHERRVVTGLREVGTSGTQFTINGRKTFMRGTLDCAVFPLTGYPPTDVDSWRKIIGTVKEYGLNHVRFHSWCPPKAAFAAADELGCYLEVECALWARVGDGGPVDEWAYREGERIVEVFGNHPSFVMMAAGNELHGPNRKTFLSAWAAYWRKRDPRRLHTGGAGCMAVPENDFHVLGSTRINHYGIWREKGNLLRTRINADPPQTTADYKERVRQEFRPIIGHETAQWCAFPNFEEIRKYTGLLKAKNFEAFRELLVENGMGDRARDFLMASGKLQALVKKEEIESALRTPGLGGFQLLGLQDFPGQGTALVGILDAFWESKGYVTPEEHRRYCNSTVVLARIPKLTYTAGETFSADLEVAHFGPAPLAGARIVWRLADATGKVVADGSLPPAAIPVDNGVQVGSVEVVLRDLESPQRYVFTAGIEGTSYFNDWNIWVYPAAVDTAVPAGVRLARALDSDTLRFLEKGGSVLLALDPAAVRTDVAIGFSPAYWNTFWTREEPPHTLGILCDPSHPALVRFPTDYHADWQWWELIHGSAAMVLDRLPANLRPIVQPIDTWFRNRRCGLLFEANVLGGRLLVSSMDLTTRLEVRPVARQMLHSLLAYMASPLFNPQVSVNPAAILSLCRSGGRATGGDA